jgi:F-type H+-transporting ATPase subunit a
MISLFTSFDVYFFYKGVIRFLLVFSVILSSLFKLNLLNSIVSSIHHGLLSFFYSLKSKRFNKLSSLIFFSIFSIICLINLFSVFPFNFPLTSQVRVILRIALGVWLRIVLFSVTKVPRKFFYHLIPEGSPIVLAFVLFLIEIVRNLIRPITLIIRLVANILAGHLLIILLSGLVYFFPYSYFFYVILNMVEIFVALIQSYIFSTILVLYYSEV